MFGVVGQIDLEAVPWLQGNEVIKVSVVHHLTFDESHEAIAHTHDWEVLVCLVVMVLCPEQDLLDLLGVLKSFPVGDQACAVSWNIQAINWFKFWLDQLHILWEVDGNNPSASWLQEFDVRAFNEESLKCLLEFRLHLLIFFINYLLNSFIFLFPYVVLWDWLHQNADNWAICLCSNVVTGTDHWWFSQMFMGALWVFRCLCTIQVLMDLWNTSLVLNIGDFERFHILEQWVKNISQSFLNIWRQWNPKNTIHCMYLIHQ